LCCDGSPKKTQKLAVHAVACEMYKALLCCCVCLLLQYLIQSCARGGRRIVEDMYYEIRRAEACMD
jgi:hypothetical protein